MLFTEYIENKEDDDFIFLGEKDIKYRYQSFNNMLKKGFPLPIRNNSENFTAFLSHPFKVLKRAIKDDSELVQLIPKQ